MADSYPSKQRIRALRLGTRKSLLAMTQSAGVARILMEKNPGLQIELVGIETQGDRILDVPLSKIEGKEFFVAQLDEALLANQVDLCVHSLKDLSLQRPEKIFLGAIPMRENPRDVLIAAPGLHERLIAQAGSSEQLTVRVGTSSPRRLENLRTLLSDLLPFQGSPHRMEFLDLRGNVNTRLRRLHDSSGENKQKLDAIVLAAAGINRLFDQPKARAEIEDLLKGCKLMMLPILENPTAPGQGALAVECLRDDKDLRKLLRESLHCEVTENQVGFERQMLAAWGGGCHLKLGATVLEFPQIGEVLVVRGQHPGGGHVREQRRLRRVDHASLKLGSLVPSKQDAFSSSVFRLNSERPVDHSISAEALKIAEQCDVWLLHHSRALPDWNHQTKHIWISGMESWRRLAARGVWVEGIFDEEKWGQVPLGRTFFERNPCLGLAKAKACEFTHAAAQASRDKSLDLQSSAGAISDNNEVIATYMLEARDLDQASQKKLSSAKTFYWTSSSQFEAARRYLSKEQLQKGIHCCGMGKTLRFLRPVLKEFQNEPHVFLNEGEWREWLDTL